MNVKNENLVKGKDYLVGDELDKLEIRKFLVINSLDVALFETVTVANSAYGGYKCIKETEPKYWSLDTCPLPPFTVKCKAIGWYSTVHAISDRTVSLPSGSYTYREIFEEYLYIPDRTNRKIELPCGIKK